MRDTALETSRPMSTFQPPIHCASGCAAIRSISAASAGRLFRHASAWRFAEDAGSTKSVAPEKRLMKARLTVCAAEGRALATEHTATASATEAALRAFARLCARIAVRAVRVRVIAGKYAHDHVTRESRPGSARYNPLTTSAVLTAPLHL